MSSDKLEPVLDVALQGVAYQRAQRASLEDKAIPYSVQGYASRTADQCQR